MSSHREARSTAKIRAPNISSTTTVCTHGVPMFADSLAIRWPESPLNACDYKDVFDVLVASKLAIVKKLEVAPVWPIKATFVLRLHFERASRTQS